MTNRFQECELAAGQGELKKTLAYFKAWRELAKDKEKTGTRGDPHHHHLRERMEKT